MIKSDDKAVEVGSSIGILQDLCEGPVSLRFIMRAAIGTAVWPLQKPGFCKRAQGESNIGCSKRRRGLATF